MNPDATGNYTEIAKYNGKASYVLAGGGWYIWWDGVDTWNISTVQGTQGTNYWTRTDPAMVGVYSPGGSATGDATVALHV